MERGAPTRLASPPPVEPLGVSSKVIPPLRDTLAEWTSFLFDLLQGAGIAAAIGIRPFLPVLLVGALAAANLGIDFDGTDFAFLEQAPALAIVLVMLALATFAVRRSGPDAPERPPYVWVFAAIAIVLGALAGRGVARRPRPSRSSPA